MTAAASQRITFSGSPELAPLWDEFVANYTENGKHPHRLRDAALLNEAAFGRRAFPAIEAIADAATRAAMRHGLGNILLFLSRRSADEAMRPLHRAVVDELTKQWIEVERKHGLYPPPPLSTHLGVKYEVRADVRDRQRRLLRTPEGSLPAGMLRLAHDSTIRAEAALACRRVSSNVNPDDALLCACEFFDQQLFRFDREKVTQDTSFFTGFVHLGMRKYLDHALLRRLKKTSMLTSIDNIRPNDGMSDTHHSGRDDDLRLKVAVSESEPSRPAIALDELLKSENRSLIYRACETLTPRQREVLWLRFGFVDGIHHTLQQVSDCLGITPQRVAQIEQTAMKRFEDRYRDLTRDYRSRER